MSNFAPRSAPLLLALGLAVGIGTALGLSCGGDDPGEESHPEPPPAEIDAGAAANDAGGESCPESSPKIGDNCRTTTVEETCTYPGGSCTVNDQTYEKQDSFRCFEGNWIKWPQPEPSPCD
jgi:hypothetical protein